MSGIKDKHFMSHSREYKTWEMMLQRCLNEKFSHYPMYGGRGIKVCDDWLDFKKFWKDMGTRPEGKTLDRIDVNGDYCRANCRWASSSLQVYNTRRRLDNTSVVCGVYYHKASGKWMASITVEGNAKYLGLFSEKDSAIEARKVAENLYFGFEKCQGIASEETVDIEDIS